MPKVEVEILRTVTVTREETATVELDIPKYILRDGGEFNWVDDQAQNPDSKVAKALKEATWDTTDESDEAEYNEIGAVSD